MSAADAFDRSAALRNRCQAVAAAIAATETYAAHVHDQVAAGPSSLAGQATQRAAHAQWFAAQETEVARGGRLFHRYPGDPSPT